MGPSGARAEVSSKLAPGTIDSSRTGPSRIDTGGTYIYMSINILIAALAANPCINTAYDCLLNERIVLVCCRPNWVSWLS